LVKVSQENVRALKLFNTPQAEFVNTTETLLCYKANRGRSSAVSEKQCKANLHE
jgi:hypothetical protein